MFGVAYSPDGSKIASALYKRRGSSEGASIIIWDRQSRAALHRLKAHTGRSRCVAFAPDGAVIATGGDDHTIRLWDTHAGREVQRQTDVNDVYSVTFSPDGKLRASTNGQAIRWWRIPSLQEYKADSIHLSSDVFTLHMSRHAPMMACGGRGPTVSILDPTKRRITTSLAIAGSGLSDLALSSDAGTMVVRQLNGPAEAWDIPGRHLLASLTDQGGLAVAMSADDRWVAVEYYDGAIGIWETLTWAGVRTLKHDQGYIHSFAFSPNSKELASGGARGTIILWQTRHRNRAIETRNCAIACKSSSSR